MKKFLLLLKHEYNGMFLPLCIIIAALAILQIILFSNALRGDYFNAPFSHYVNSARISAVFAIAYAGLLVLMGVRFLRNFAPSKNIYALLTIPVKRGHVYLAELAAALIAGFVLLAAQMAIVLLLYMQFWAFGPETGRRGAGLYLALLDVGFLRLLFPPDFLSLLFTFLGFFGSVSVTFFAAVKLKSGGVVSAIILSAVWLVLLLWSFPIGSFGYAGNAIAFALMLAIPVIAAIRGVKLFESGEVAR